MDNLYALIVLITLILIQIKIFAHAILILLVKIKHGAINVMMIKKVLQDVMNLKDVITLYSTIN